MLGSVFVQQPLVASIQMDEQCVLIDSMVCTTIFSTFCQMLSQAPWVGVPILWCGNRRLPP